MANYKESPVQGTSWKRCKRIDIDNPHVSVGRVPSVIFHEEEIVDTGNNNFFISQSTNSQLPSIYVLVNPSSLIDLYDPQTGEKTGSSITHAELYSILYSAYRTEAEKRDIQLQNSNL